ncbi:MAG: hypothetical protein WC303_01350 [Candidatus Paceibacterota bacterium]|jgi:hypothetical protein
MEKKFEQKFEKKPLSPEQGKDFLDLEKKEKVSAIEDNVTEQAINETILTTEQEDSQVDKKNINPVLQNKLKYYLDMAEERGIDKTIKIIEELKDPFLLDSFHDVVAKENLFEKFLNKKKK